jgi:hypothetical protein
MLPGTRTAIATLAVTSLALTAASPACAIYRDHVTAGEAPTTDRVLDQPVGTKSCTIEITGADGTKTTVSYPPGSKIKLNGREYECQDGSWVPTAPMDSVNSGGDYVYEAVLAYPERDGTLVGVNLRADYASNDGAYYAEP